MWYVFEFEHGGYPVLVTTEEEKQRILNKHKGKVAQLNDREYFVKE